MAISSSDITAGPYTTNGSTTQFSFSFRVADYGDVEAEDQVKVVLVTISTGAETVLTRGVSAGQYTVSVNGDQDSSPGGSITTISTYASGYYLYIRLKPSFTQQTELVNQGAFNASVIEEQFDQMTRQILDLNDRVRRSPVAGLQIGESFSGEITGTPVAGYIPQLNSGLTGFDWVANNGSSNLVTATGSPTARTLGDWFAGIDKDEDRTLFASDSATEADSVVTFTRTFDDTAASRVATAIFRNPGDAAGGSDYQNEVQILLWAGTTDNHRRYFRYIQGSGDDDWTEGVNAQSVKILFEEVGNQHRIWMEPARLTGDTLINAGGAGAAGKTRFGYHAADTLPQTNVRFHRGGNVTPANNVRTFEFDAYNSIFYKYAVDGTTAQIVIDADGDVGIGKGTPGYKIDIETAGGSPFRFVWSNGSFRHDAHSSVWTTTGTNASDMLTLTDGDNNAGRAVLNLKGNAGAVEVLFAASNGNVGIKTGASPTAALDVNSDVMRLRTAKTPASAAATGNAGDICWDSDYIYVCVAANTWKRAAISTW